MQESDCKLIEKKKIKYTFLYDIHVKEKQMRDEVEKQKINKKHKTTVMMAEKDWDSVGRQLNYPDFNIQ